eukprot:287621_1
MEQKNTDGIMIGPHAQASIQSSYFWPCFTQHIYYFILHSTPHHCGSYYFVTSYHSNPFFSSCAYIWLLFLFINRIDVTMASLHGILYALKEAKFGNGPNSMMIGSLNVQDDTNTIKENKFF